MAITLADFTKIWASTSPLTPYSFSDANYQEGWNFVGATPPARQMWDYIQKNNDEKLKYIVDNFLPLSGGTMTGEIALTGNAHRINRDNNTSYTGICGGTEYAGGGNAYFWGKDADDTFKGAFRLGAIDTDGTGHVFIGKPDGSLTWDGKAVVVGNQYTQTFANVSVNANANKLVGQLDYNPTYYSVKIDGSGYADISAMINTTNRNVYIRNLSSSNLSSLNVIVNYIVL